ncbi:MAG: hypothetical protein IPM43_06680 [Actinomycetota bacterium]|nr:MAG: hypothetical protein IPM43_06680 [Actinomycetota bacterium]
MTGEASDAGLPCPVASLVLSPVQAAARPPTLGARSERLLVPLVALSLWMPALSLPVSRRFVQLSDVVGLIAAFVLIPRLANLRTWQLAPVWLMYLSWAWALLAGPGGERSLDVAIFYATLLGPFLLLFALGLGTSEGITGFMRWFAIGGLLNCAVAAVQGVLGSAALDLRNNTNFSLPPQLQRVYGLFPEASGLSIMLQVLVALLIANELTANPARLAPLLRRPLIVAAVVCLGLTRSSSVFVTLPLLVVLAVVKAPTRPSRKLLATVVALAVVPLLAAVYVSGAYGQRIEQGSGFRSAAGRYSTVSAAVDAALRDPIAGVGLGENTQVTAAAALRAQGLGTGAIQVSDGINSVTATRLYEEGIFAFAGTALALYGLARLLARRLGPLDHLMFVVLAGSFLAATVVSGYRGFYFTWLWYLTPVAVGWVARRPAVAA